MALYTKQFSSKDDYMTPFSAWEDIREFLPKDKVVWEAFYGDGKSGEYLRSLGCDVIHEDIDFFEHDLGECIVSNPPFSKSRQVLERLREMEKPFILLLPAGKLFTKYYRAAFGNDPDMSLIIPPKRINFMPLKDGEVDVSYKSNCAFDCIYYCWRMGIKERIIHL